MSTRCFGIRDNCSGFFTLEAFRDLPASVLLYEETGIFIKTRIHLFLINRIEPKQNEDFSEKMLFVSAI